MKKILLLGSVLFTLQIGWSQLINESFESGDFPTGWTQNSSYVNSGSANTGTYKAGMNATGDWITSTQVTNPGTLSLWVRTSSDPDNWVLELQTSPDGTTWTTHLSITEDGTGGDVTNTYSQKTVDINLTGDYYIRFFISSRSAGSCYIDDILLTEYNGSSNDQTSTVKTPGTQLPAGTMSSIATDSVPVIRFDITDAASGDGLPTVVTGINFVSGPDNTLPFDSLNGGGIYDLTNSAVIPLTFEPTVNSTSAYLPVNITIPDGATVSFEAYAYINNSYAPDGAVLQFQINAASHGFTTDAAGSGFEATFAGGDIVGNDFTIDVVATQFTFTGQPSNVVVGDNVTPAVQVGTTDINGNVDIDYPDTFIQLSFSGTGGMYGASGNTAINGIANYPDLNFNTPETAVHLTASGGTFADVNSSDFDILSGSGGADCANAVSVDVGTHHAIHPQGSNGDYDQWYVYTAPADGTITVSDCGISTIDTDVQIIADNCSGTNFDEADDVCDSQETLDFTVVAGQSYYIGWGNWDAAGSEHDWTLTFTAAATPINIINAYSVNEDSLVVFYESGLTSANPADYTLTAIGQVQVNFTQASIDATYDSIVYLKAQSNFTPNTIRDNLNDAGTNSTPYQFYAGVLPIAKTNTANATDTVRQGYNFTLTGIVTANDNYNQVWIQDSNNAMSGVMIFSSSFTSEVAVGDSITIVGQKALYNGATEIVSPLLINKVSGFTPTAAIVNSSDLAYLKSQDDADAEPWEGQLVALTGITIDSLNSSHYEYFGHDCSGNIICFDDDVDYHYGSGFSLDIGSMYSITGVVTYSYGHYKINPRGISDASDITRDFTSLAGDPDSQVPTQIIDGTQAIDSLHAIEAFKFKITDEGTDGLPTKLTQFVLYLGSNNTVDFTGDVISGGWFDFGDAANPIEFAGEPVFDTDHFTFIVDPESAVVDNGTSKEVILHLWFDESLLVDESVVQFMLKADPHGFVADCMNSQFESTFANDIIGGSLTIDTNVNVNEINGASIKVYPNPSNGIFNINVKDTYILKITDITGRVINSEIINGDSSIKLNTAGVYFLKFSNENGSYTKKVIVK